MSLAELAYDQKLRPRTGAPCSVAALLTKLDDTERDALLFMLYGEQRAQGGWGWPMTAVYAALVKEGHTVSQQQINRHRSGQCRCEGDK